MGQNLHPFLGRQGESLFHLLVRHGGVAPVFFFALVGGAKPGGTPLGGAVQEDFHATQPQPIVVAIHTVGESHPGGVEVGHAGIAHHVQGQGVLGQQPLIEGEEFRGHHALLGGGDAVGGVGVLGPGEGVFQLVKPGHGGLTEVVHKGVFLRVPGEFPTVSAKGAPFRVGGAPREEQLVEGGGVEHPHMSRGVLDDHWVVGGGLVQQFTGGVGVLGEVVVVIALAEHPLSRGDVVVPDESGHRLLQLGEVAHFPQGHLQQAVGGGGQVAVGVHKSGQQGVPLQVHFGGSGGIEGIGAQGHNTPIFH